MGALAVIVRTYARALGLLRTERALVAMLVLANFAIASFQLAEPILAGHIVDLLAKGEAVSGTIALWASLGLFNIFSGAMLALMADRLAHRQKLQALVAGFERALMLTVDDYADQGASRLVRTLHGGMTHLFDLWLAFLREHLTAFAGVLLLVPTALSIDGRLAGVLGLLAVMYLCANAFVIWRTHFNQREVESHHQNVFARLGDAIANATTVQSYNRVPNEVAALRGLAAELLQMQYPVLIWWAVLIIFTRSAATISMVAVFATGAALAARGEVTVGQIVAFMGFATLLIGKLDQLSGFVARLFLQVAALTHFFDLMDRQPAPVENANAAPLGIVRGDVRFEQATFRFTNSRQGVFDLDFQVVAGETIAIVEPTGAGKSTTLALLQRLRDPHRGRVMIDRRDIRDVTIGSLRDATAVVFQQAGLFNRSIADNIRIGRPLASDEKVIAAARPFEKSAYSHSRRGDKLVGHRDRGKDQTCHRSGSAWAHDLHHRTPYVDGRERPPDRRSRSRPDRGDGNLWRLGQGRGALPGSANLKRATSGVLAWRSRRLRIRRRDAGW
ncbi:MAG: ABC transporter transmembrane domain-containing protein [Methylocella sp.]